MDVSIIIVSYNVRHFLEQTLLSVRRAAEGMSVEIWVVDNCSTDDSVAVVRNRFPDVHLIANTTNAGFSIANNQAIRQSSGRYVLLLNPDTLVGEDTLGACLKFMDSRPDAGGLGVKMLDGSGHFLPESKRGLPTPAVAFYKAFGWSKLFPRSAVYNRYHLGHLSREKTNEVDVLSGAFMWLRRAALDKVGLLDETFFMYGEDIDLSYRIQRGGYKNYYLADTRILHYKGESTKKGSLNYVKVFYRAMIIFVQKHFSGQNANLFTYSLRLAIYFRGFLTLIGSFLKKTKWPLLDACLIFGGLYWLKDFWATTYFDNPNYYKPSFLYFNVPLYIAGWLGGIYFHGGYDGTTSNLRKTLRGLVTGSVLLAAVYGFLPAAYRTSRMLLLLGAVWAVISTVALRLLARIVRTRSIQLNNSGTSQLAIIGDLTEAERIQRLMLRAVRPPRFIGVIAAKPTTDERYLGSLDELPQLTQLYGLTEVIFCAENVAHQQTLHWMETLAGTLHFRTVPAGTDTIIGSFSKNNPGELYTLSVQYRLNDPVQRRSKRLFDVLGALFALLFSPVLLWTYRQPGKFVVNCCQVLLGRKTWVGFGPVASVDNQLPVLKPSILLPGPPEAATVTSSTQKRLNFLYARDYDWTRDATIWWAGLRFLDR